MAKISLTDGKMSGLILSDLIELIKDAKAFCKYKTEMITLKDIQSKVLYLPLTAEGVFGEELEDKLEKRKEQREQLKELLPEFSNKRKQDFNTKQDKTPRYSVNNNMNTNNNLSNDSRRSGFSVNKPTSKFTPRNQQKY
jgi:macrodomain Ter protein organizer (MatP/YcbG family)